MPRDGMEHNRQQEWPRMFLHRHPFGGKHHAFATVDIHHMMVKADKLLSLFAGTDGYRLIWVDSIEVGWSGHGFSPFLYIVLSMHMMIYDHRRLEWLKGWAREILTTENTECTEKIKEKLRVLRALCGEWFRQAHTIIHSPSTTAVERLIRYSRIGWRQTFSRCHQRRCLSGA